MKLTPEEYRPLAKSKMAGSAVMCAIACAVLETLEDEGREITEDIVNRVVSVALDREDADWMATLGPICDEIRDEAGFSEPRI